MIQRFDSSDRLILSPHVVHDKLDKVVTRIEQGLLTIVKSFSRNGMRVILLVTSLSIIMCRNTSDLVDPTPTEKSSEVDNNCY